MSPPPAASSAAVPVAPAETDDSRWFREEIQVHEPALRAFLRSRFPKLPDIEDLIHDCYAKLLRARATSPIHHPRGYLFAAARNAALSLFRHNSVVPMEQLADVDRIPAPPSDVSFMEGVSAEQQESLLHEAIASLPPRGREVLTLRRLHGLSRPEIARRMGISENTVNAHLTAAMMGCRRFFMAKGLIQEDEP